MLFVIGLTVEPSYELSSTLRSEPDVSESFYRIEIEGKD